MLRLIALASSLALAQGYAACTTSHFNVHDELVQQHNVDGTMNPAKVTLGGADMAAPDRRDPCDQIAAIGPDGSLRGVGDGDSLGWLGE